MCEADPESIEANLPYDTVQPKLYRGRAGDGDDGGWIVYP
jgi:hypothetical protein